MSIFSASSFKAAGTDLIKNEKITFKTSPSQVTSNTITLPPVNADDSFALTSQIPSLANYARTDLNNTFSGTQNFNALKANTFQLASTAVVSAINTVKAVTPADTNILTEKATITEITNGDTTTLASAKTYTDAASNLKVDKIVDCSASTPVKIISCQNSNQIEFARSEAKTSNTNKFAQHVNFFMVSDLTKKTANYYPGEVLDLNSCLGGAGNGCIKYMISNKAGLSMGSAGRYWDAGSFYLPSGVYLDRCIHLQFDFSFCFYRSSDSSLYTMGTGMRRVFIQKQGTNAPIITNITDSINALPPATNIELTSFVATLNGSPDFLSWGLSSGYFGMNGSVSFDVTLLVTTFN